MTRAARSRALTLSICIGFAGCAQDHPPNLVTRPTLASSVEALDLPPGMSAATRLGLGEVGALAVRNSPDLRAARAQSGVPRAQVVQAGLLPDPVLSGSYGVLLGGPALYNAIGATLTADITALVTLSVRRRSAVAAAQQVDASIVWQEWQTISRAQTLTIDLVQQGRLLASYRQTLSLLARRVASTTRAVEQGNATLQMLAPDVAALTALQTQLDAVVLAQEERWQALDALLGLEPQVRPALATVLTAPTVPPGETARLLADLARRRPDLIALQLGYQSQQAAVRAAILGQFPALTIGPNYGSDTSRVVTLGPAISIGLPLFNRNRGAIAIAGATREQLRLEYTARLDAASAGAQALLANLALLERQHSDARAGLNQAERLAAGAQRGLDAGLIDELSYVQLITARLEKERQVIGLEQQVLDTRVALATLLGVGLPPVPIEGLPSTGNA